MKHILISGNNITCHALRFFFFSVGEFTQKNSLHLQCLEGGRKPLTTSSSARVTNSGNWVISLAENCPKLSHELRIKSSLYLQSTLRWCISDARYISKHFTHIISFYPYSNLMKWILLIQFYSLQVRKLRHTELKAM